MHAVRVCGTRVHLHACYIRKTHVNTNHQFHLQHVLDLHVVPVRCAHAMHSRWHGRARPSVAGPHSFPARPRARDGSLAPASLARPSSVRSRTTPANCTSYGTVKPSGPLDLFYTAGLLEDGRA